jgi:hypothetical protein
MQHDICLAEQTRGPQGQQFGIAGACPDQKNLTHESLHRDAIASSSVRHSARPHRDARGAG